VQSAVAVRLDDDALFFHKLVLEVVDFHAGVHDHEPDVAEQRVVVLLHLGAAPDLGFKREHLELHQHDRLHHNHINGGVDEEVPLEGLTHEFVFVELLQPREQFEQNHHQRQQLEYHPQLVHERLQIQHVLETQVGHDVFPVLPLRSGLLIVD